VPATHNVHNSTSVPNKVYSNSCNSCLLRMIQGRLFTVHHTRAQLGLLPQNTSAPHFLQLQSQRTSLVFFSHRTSQRPRHSGAHGSGGALAPALSSARREKPAEAGIRLPSHAYGICETLKPTDSPIRRHSNFKKQSHTPYSANPCVHPSQN